MALSHKLERKNLKLECKDKHIFLVRENEWGGSLYIEVNKGRNTILKLFTYIKTKNASLSPKW
jgi:hypothetical protein